MRKEIMLSRGLAIALMTMLMMSVGIRYAFSLQPPVTEWNKTYGGASDDIAYSVVQTSDGGYALIGVTQSFGAGDWDLWLFKTDSTGNMQWNKTYGETGSEGGAGSLVETGDGGYVFAGLTYSFGAGSADAWLVKTDAAGNMLWNRTYGGTSDDFSFSLVRTADGGYAIAGFTKSFGAGDWDLWLVKTDASGNMQWNETYGGGALDMADCVVQTSDGGYAIAGRTESFGAGYRDYWLVKTDAGGNMQWNKTYGGTNMDEAYSVVQTYDGGYALVGYSESFGAGGDAWLVKTDSNGTMQWNKTYGGTNGDYATLFIQTSNGGYALTGSTHSFGADGYDAWLVKVIENNPPEFGVPSQNPPRDNARPFQDVMVSVNVTDAESGVKNATLYYSLTNGTTWEAPVPMSLNATTSLYEATIPGQSIGTWVRFKMVAYDIAGNNATKEGIEPYFTYQIVPEFPTTAVLLLFAILTLLAVMFTRKGLFIKPKT